jgi:hypothetical protein
MWSAPAERSGDGALDRVIQSDAACTTRIKSSLAVVGHRKSKAPSPLRSAGALQMRASDTFNSDIKTDGTTWRTKRCFI